MPLKFTQVLPAAGGATAHSNSNSGRPKRRRKRRRRRARRRRNTNTCHGRRDERDPGPSHPGLAPAPHTRSRDDAAPGPRGRRRGPPVPGGGTPLLARTRAPTAAGSPPASSSPCWSRPSRRRRSGCSSWWWTRSACPTTSARFAAIALATLGMRAREGPPRVPGRLDLAAWVGERFVLDLRTRVFRHLQTLSPEALDGGAMGDRVERVSKAMSRRSRSSRCRGWRRRLSAVVRIVVFAGALLSTWTGCSRCVALVAWRRCSGSRCGALLAPRQGRTRARSAGAAGR